MAHFEYTQTKSLEIHVLLLQQWIRVWFIAGEMSIEMNFSVL